MTLALFVPCLWPQILSFYPINQDRESQRKGGVDLTQGGLQVFPRGVRNPRLRGVRSDQRP